MSFVLNPRMHKTGWVWHICLDRLESTELEYAYQINGNNENPCNRFDPHILLSDPYALGLNTGHKWGEVDLNDKRFSLKGKVILEKPFDWEGTLSPKIPLEDVIIYELHTRGFTVASHSQTKYPGSFLALVEKIPYLKSLGVNAIELMPIFEFNEREIHRVNPKTGQLLKNVWGYSDDQFLCSYEPIRLFRCMDKCNR